MRAPELMHRAMNSSFHCTLARNFCWKSPRCTNPSQFQIHFRYLSKNLCPSHLLKKVYKKTQHRLQHRCIGPVRNTAFTLSPVLSEKFFLHRKINYEHQILFEKKKKSFRTRVAAQNLAPIILLPQNDES